MILREAIERYVLWRRAHGAKFTTGESSVHLVNVVVAARAV